MLHGHLRDYLRRGGGGRGGKRGGKGEGPGVDYLCSVGVDYFDGLAGIKGGGDAVAGGDGC